MEGKAFFPDGIGMKRKVENVTPYYFRADIQLETFNEEDLSFEVEFASEIKATRRDYWTGKKYIEILSCKPESVRLDRINAGGPVLDNHMGYSVKTQLGVVERAWIAEGKGRAKIRLSNREDNKGLVQDVKDKIVRNISVGYDVHAYEFTEGSEGSLDTYRATDWEPFELSFAPIPVDYTVGTRSNDPKDIPAGHRVTVTTQNKRNMDEEEVVQGQPPVATQQRAANPAAPATQTTPATAPDAVATRSQGVNEERARITSITQAVRTARIEDQAFLDDLITRGVSVDQAREAIINRWGEDQNNTQIRGQQTVQVGADATDKRRSAMENAIQHRANPSVELTPEGREFRGLNLVDMGRECLTAAGISTRGMSRAEVAQTALNMRSAIGMHSTSDFPIILGNTVNRTLQAEYEIRERTFTSWASRGTAKDFREMTRVGIGEVGDFKEVKEGGEYEYTTVSENGEKYKVVKYGQIIAITWETLINDDLDAFSRIPRKITDAAARKQSDLVYAILTGSHKMSDGKELFHIDHKNLITSGSAIGIDSIGAMRALLRNQTGIGGKDVLNLYPKYMLVGPANEQLALQYSSSEYTPNVAGNINVWKGLYTPIVEPRIAGNAWYFAAAPGIIDTIEYSFLEGEPELFTEQRNGFDVDGLEIKARMVFGAKAIDWRGLAKNVGA